MLANFPGMKMNGAMMNGAITPPKGWKVAENPEVEQARLDADRLRENLSLACKKAVHLIDRIQNELGVHIPESYMRVEVDNTFHVLLLTSQEDFLSPKIQAARIVAEDYSAGENRFDIRFSFTNLEENLHKTSILDNGYMLKHIAEDSDLVLVDNKGAS